ncbi:MAG: DUF1588 domain-containing protein [Gammaproteobacteria bacterium]|nr:DUF1588 domain-containing protein [Gammaproteobacteria bacterium]MDE0441790.1 DUF1588 domain-containing protein [Gammaproteobacteria bacterium]
MNRFHEFLWRTLVAAATGAVVAASLAADPEQTADAWLVDSPGPEAWRITQPFPLTVHEDLAPWPRSMPTHPGVHDTLFASTPMQPNAALMCPVPSSGPFRDHSGAADQAGEAARAHAQTTAASQWKPARGGKPRSVSPLAAAAAKTTPLHGAAGSTGASSGDSAAPQGVPLFPSASDNVQEGFVRVINHSPMSGEVRIDAIDDSGRIAHPVTLALGARETVHFNSGDLERGNAAKGLSGSAGSGVGDWRLGMESDLDIEVLAYVRTADGFLTAMHDVVRSEDGVHRVPTFNPASNRDQVSRLRVVNLGESEAQVTIRGVDDAGYSPSTIIRIHIPPGAAQTLDAEQLEAGTSDWDGLGDGTGKWRLLIESEQAVEVLSLLESPTRHLSNLSTTPPDAVGDRHAVPLFPGAGGDRQGFVRVINRSDEPGDVRIRAFDDSDWDYDEITLSLGANAVAHFNSDDLETGNPGKGLSGGVGSGQGDWRLAMTSDLDVEVLAYVRTTEGFLTAMHDVAPSIGVRHRVAVFNPGSNLDQVSQLRLVNAGEQPTDIVITGIDGNGATPNTDVRLTVPGGQTRTITAQQLESGADWLEGALGDGEGKWQLNVRSAQPIMVMSLLASPTGHLTNLSTAPARGANETSTEVFDALVAAPVLESKCVNCHVEGGPSGTTRLVFVSTANSDHRALNLQAIKNFVATVEDGAALVLEKIQGIGHGGGEQVPRGSKDFENVAWFLDLLGREAAAVSASAETLFDAVAMASPRTVLRRAALLFAGRIPTGAEYDFIEPGTDDVLREAIRNLMTGPRFHEFLLRGANDRLLTDRYVAENTLENRGHFFHFDNKYYRLRGAAVNNGAHREFNEWHNAVQYGVARAPLELIAHVVENDLPYTEVLTADYVMANRLAKESYTGKGAVDHPDDVHDFRPAEITDYLTHQAGYRARFEPNIGLRILSPGEGKTSIPHAGVLNTLVFLKRYPTTATNRNRARARWTYYHFLGVDIENAASRTTDPVALADTNNPTMKNANCTVCHTVLDPAAGAFQNYGDIGLYRDEPGGLDSLDGFYKNPVGEEFAIEAASYEDRQTVVAPVELDGESRVYIAFTNDYWRDGDDRNLRLDTLDLRDAVGNVVFEADLAALENQTCGEAVAAEDGGNADHWVILNGCGVRVDVEIPAVGTYEAGVTAWADQAGDELAKLEIAASPYRTGDTWYRDMREPGFNGESLADSATGLQWLARHIADDPRFAEATVKFWWPAIMGRDVVESPQDEHDADFDARLLAASAQAAHVRALAEGFRDGFDDGEPYNLKDLFVEIALSDWFRAEAIDGESSAIQRAALAHAGISRLLTPEELAHKTDTITGFQWGRWEHPSARPFRQHTNALADVRGYRLLYGGIDSDGITDRSRDLTSVMASVARTHAVESSCPIVFREFYLLPDEDRRLFGGIHKNVSPVAETGGSFSIEAESFDERETLVVNGHLPAGTNTVWLSFPNDYYNEDSGADRNVRLDALEVVDSNGAIVERVEFEDLEESCGSSESSDGSEEPDHRALWQPCELRIPLEIPTGGVHDVKVIAWADLAGGQLPFLDVAVESNTETSAGSRAIRNKLVELYDKLLGIEVGAESPEVVDAYGLFVDVWQRRRETNNNWFFDTACNWGSDIRYFDGIADDVLIKHERDWGSYYGWDWPRVNQILYDEAAPYDSAAVVRSWSIVLTYLLMDYRYLYL